MNLRTETPACSREILSELNSCFSLQAENNKDADPQRIAGRQTALQVIDGIISQHGTTEEEIYKYLSRVCQETLASLLPEKDLTPYQQGILDVEGMLQTLIDSPSS